MPPPIRVPPLLRTGGLVALVVFGTGLQCDPALPGSTVCAFDNAHQRCAYSDDYDPAAYDSDWTVLTTNDLHTCVDACGGLGYLRTVQTGVIVDESSYTITDAQIASDMEEASDWLFGLTGTTMELHGISRLTATPTSMSAAIGAYHSAHAADPPHFVMVIAADANALSFGGYAISSAPLAGYCNDFASPLGSDRIYGAVVDWTHRFGACGYDIENYHDTGEWVELSMTSLDDGSCLGTAGVACVANPVVGYNVCSNIDASLPYLQHPRAFAHSVFIHEIMHHFGSAGNLDHFGSATCDANMGGVSYGAGDLAVAQAFCGMCPNVYDNFVDGYSACP